MLRIRSLQKTFLPGTPNAVAALCSVDLDIEDGCFAGIIGTNGSGKSTLLNAVAGTFLPDGGTIPLSQTANPVQVDQVLSTLDQPTRTIKSAPCSITDCRSAGLA